MKRLAVSCGGTGGHFNPGLSVARAFRDAGGEVLLLLGGKHAERQKELAARHGIESRIVSCAPLSKSPSGLAGFFFKSARGIMQSRKICREFQPDALLAMGSFASVPPMLAAKTLGVPLFLHDGNARVGKSNRFFSRLAEAAALSFPAVNADAIHCPAHVTGLPLRSAVLDGAATSRESAIAKINERWNAGFVPELPIVLVFGGSLGAAAINDNFSVPEARRNELQIIHLSGPGKYESIREKYRKAGIRALTLESLEDMQLAYAAADLVVCRSGGSTISELALFGRGAVLIPYPYAAEDHQNDNARLYAATGAARILPNEQCSPQTFEAILDDFLNRREEWVERGAKGTAMARPDAARAILAMIDSHLEQRKSGNAS